MYKNNNKYVNYNTYLDISKKVKKLVIVALKKIKNDEKAYVILTSIAHHLILDMYKLVKSSFELDLIKKKKKIKKFFLFPKLLIF